MFKLIFQFILALTVASAGEFYMLARDAMHGIRLYSRLKKQKNSLYYNLYRARLEACSRCDIFYKPLKTCGSPLKYWFKKGPATGCWCYMPLKAILVDAQCWLDENNLSGGWKTSIKDIHLNELLDRKKD